jgi:hypothetical protein
MDILKFFEWGHLPPHLQEVSRPFAHLAHDMADKFPPSAELVAGLRKLLEAKDCMVRAALAEHQAANTGEASHTG